MEFRDAVKYLRSELGLTQVELAMGLNINAITVGRWENGKTLPNRSITAVLLEFARSKGASDKCLKILSASITAAAREKLMLSGAEKATEAFAPAQHQQIVDLLNDTPSGIAIIEVDPADVAGTLRTTYYNDRFISFSGYDRDEYDALLKNNEMSFVYEEDIPALLGNTEKISRGELGTSVDTLVRCHRKDGSFRWLLLTGQLVQRRGDTCVINVAMIDVTTMQEAVDRQRINEEMLRIAAEADMRAIIIYDVKENSCRVVSRTLFSVKYAESFIDIPQSFIDRGIVAPDSADELCALFARIREGEKKIRVSLQMHSGTDKYEWFECNAATVFDAEGLPDHAVLVFHNITEQRVKEAVFRKWQQSIDSRPVESYTLFRCNLSRDASLDEQNGSLLAISFPPDVLSFNGRTKFYAEEYVYPDDRDAYYELLNSDTLLTMFYRGEHSASLEYRETAANGEVMWRRLTIEMVEYPNSADVQAFLMYEDIDDDKKAEIAARELAESDPLTGTLNRGAFIEKVDEIISENSQAHCALIILDMDGFKQINDTFGHAAGDQALQDVAAVLRSYARSGDLVCRLGGDEFLVWLRDVPYDAVIGKTAQQMCKHIRKAYSQEVLLSASAGIAVYSRDGCSFDELYPKADKALFKVKQTEKGSYAFFSEIGEEQTEEVKQALSAVSQMPGTARSVKKRRMLIVDDNETSRITLKSFFVNEYLIETAKNGAEAMIRLRHFGASLSVVLLDLLMPGVDGFTVLKRMQSDVDLRAIPVVVVTGDEQRSTLLKAFELGAAEYVAKPVDADIIRMRVRSVISKAESERLRAQNSYLMLQRNEEMKYRTVLESTGTVVIEYDWHNHVFIYDSEISKHIAGNFNHRGLWQVFLSDMVADSADVKVLQDTLLSLGGNREQNQDSKLVMLKTPEGVKQWFRMNIYKSVDDFGLAEKMLITFTNIHDEVLAKDKLLFQATRDALTGLYNRAGFLQKAAELIAAQKPGYYVIACINIENFQVINDQYGTERGDEVLCHIAAAVGGIIQSHNGICCRYSADKFAIVYPAYLQNTSELAKIYRAAAEPDCLPRPLRLRIGRYLVKDTSLSISAIFDRAAMAEALAKRRYDTHIIDYHESMRDSIMQEQQIVGDMLDALQNGEFEPWFQPQYNHATGALIGAEALVRWRRNGKIIPPNEFIPVFEKNGFIYEVDQSVWRQVCAMLRRWLDEGKNPLPVSVNISRFDMFQENFVSVLTSLIAEYRLPAELLRLEITESAFSADTNVITDIAGKLIAAGFTVEIDDFGSGYSSLNTLKDVPASIIKLDMRFFETTENSARGGNIVEAIVRMAKWLGMTIIAEGVEDRAQADYLKSIGCYYIQGYYYSRPLPADEYEKRMQEGLPERRLSHMETLESLDADLFWNPKSMETLIFNSYVGGACIFEYYGGKTELLRYNDQYISELNGLIPENAEIQDITIIPFLDDRSRKELVSALREAFDSGKEASSEMQLTKGEQTEYVRQTSRVIAKTTGRTLYYCVIQNLTEQRSLERERTENAERLSIIMSNVNGGVSAIEINDDGTSRLIFHNDKYYELYGYARAEKGKQELDPMSFIIPEDFPGVMEKVKKLKVDGQPMVIDYGILKKDGSRAQIRANASLMTMEGYGPIITSVLTDITEQRTLEEQLRAVVDNINGGVSATYLRDGKLRFEFTNDKYYEILGYTREQYETEVNSVFDIIHPDDRERVEKLFIEFVQAEIPYTMEYRIIRRNGAVRHILCNANVMHFLSVKEPIQLSVSNDITLLREAQLKEQELALQLRTIMENIQSGVSSTVYYDNNHIEIIYANDGYYELFGYTKEQLEAEVPNVLDLMLHEDREKTMTVVARIVRERGSETYEYRCRKRDGSVIWVQTTNTVISLAGVGDTVLLAITTDITERMNAEERQIDLLDNLPFGAAMFAYDGGSLTALHINKQYNLLVNREVNSALESFDPVEAIYPDDRKSVFDEIRAAISEGRNGECDIRLLYGGDEYRFFHLDASIVPRGDGKYILYVAYAPITDKEQELKITSERLKLLSDSIPGGIATFRCMPGNIEPIYYNDGICALTGYSREEFDNSRISVLGLIFDEDKPIIKKQIELLMSGETALDYSVRIHPKSGGYKWVECMASVTGQEKENVFLVSAVLTDVTEHQEERERLRISEELNRLAIDQSGKIISRYDVAARTLTLPYSLPDIYNIPRVLEKMPEEQVQLGRISPDTAEVYCGVFARINSGEAAGEATYQQNSTLGWRWLKSRFTTVFASDGRPVSAVMTFEDITEQREKEAIYARWQNAMSERSKDSYTIVRCNLNQTNILDSWEGNLLRVQFTDPTQFFNSRTAEYTERFVYADDRNAFRTFLNNDTMLAEYHRGHRSDYIDYREQNEDGSVRWLRLTVDLVEYPDSTDVEAYLLFENIDEQKQAELSAIRRAETDPLTGILNRTAFAERVNQVISRFEPQVHHALFILDVDGFKQVNDVFGHGAGDQTLIDIANSLTCFCRKDDLVGRLGGDEFFVFISDIGSAEMAAKKSRQICDMTRKAISTDIHISTSIGIALHPQDGEGFEALYKVADEALYRTKNAGKDGYCFSSGDPVIIAGAKRRDNSSANRNPIKPKQKSRRILIVDDNKTAQNTLESIFKDDYYIEKASEGSAALSMLHHYGTAISVVLLDLMMPGMSGFEVLEKMQQNNRICTIPVIVVSAVEDRETALRVIRAGASDFITKPVDADLLRIRVESAVSKSENERLRAQNSYLAIRNTEVNSYRTALERTGTMVVMLDLVSDEFSYSPLVSQMLTGQYDERSLWSILLSDKVTDEQTIQKMQQLVQEIINDKDSSEGSLKVRLKTRTGLSHMFWLYVFKELDDYGIASKLIMTLKEAVPAPNNAGSVD